MKNRRMLFALLFVVFFSTTAVTSPIPVDVKKSDWQKKSCMPDIDDALLQSKRPQFITIHYNANCSRGRLKYTVEQRMHFLCGFSKKKKDVPTGNRYSWGDVPYHFMISCENKLVEGRDLRYRPSSGTRYDTDGHITIVVEDDGKKDLSAKRKAKLIETIKALQARYDIPTSGVGVHKDHAQTSCPGPYIKRLIEQFKRQ